MVGSLKKLWRHRSEELRRAAVIGYLRLTDRHPQPRVAWVDGTPLLVLPGVFAPDSFTTRLVVSQRQLLQGKRVLDMGCGAGALAVLSAGIARTVTACDIGEAAVRNAQLNAQWHAVPHVTVVQSDLFTCVQGQFDTIVFNAPFFPGKARTAGDERWLGGDGALLRRFLAQAPRHLYPGGEIWLTHSSIADEAALFAALGDAGMRWQVMARRDIWIETFKLYRVYQERSAAEAAHG